MNNKKESEKAGFGSAETGTDDGSQAGEARCLVTGKQKGGRLLRTDGLLRRILNAWARSNPTGFRKGPRKQRLYRMAPVSGL